MRPLQRLPLPEVAETDTGQQPKTQMTFLLLQEMIQSYFQSLL